jgi:hypothetical protein
MLPTMVNYTGGVKYMILAHIDPTLLIYRGCDACLISSERECVRAEVPKQQHNGGQR